MKDLKKSHNHAGQSKAVTKSHKHDANLQKNSTLYFQIGLILCLLGTYALFEMRFEDKVYEPESYTQLLPEDHTYQMENIVVEKDAPKEEPVEQEKKVITNKFDVKDDDYEIKKVIDVVTTPEPTSTPVDPNAFKEPEKPEEVIAKPFNITNVEIVPIYPGCERKNNNKERIKCMNEKLARLVQRKFDTDLASEYGLEGKQRIDVQFKINPNGEIVDIKTRAPHPMLKKEAERVTKKIPKMKPGLQREKPVSVMYNLPIIFNVNQ